MMTSSYDSYLVLSPWLFSLIEFEQNEARATVDATSEPTGGAAPEPDPIVPSTVCMSHILYDVIK